MMKMSGIIGLLGVLRYQLSCSWVKIFSVGDESVACAVIFIEVVGFKAGEVDSVLG